MKKIDHFNAFEKQLREFSLSQLSHIYLMIGDHPLELSRGVDLLLNHLLPDSLSREHSLIQLEGSQLNESDLLSGFQSCSLFATKRVLLIHHVEKIKKNLIEKLEKQILNSKNSQYLILTGSTACKNMSLYQLVEQQGQIAQFGEIKPWEREEKLAEWVHREIVADKKEASMQACRYFVRYIGLDQNILSKELDKLLCYCHKKETITQHDIMAICTKQPAYTAWQLGEAILKRESQLALQVARALLSDGQSILPLLRQVRSLVQTGYHICHLLATGKSSNEIALKFPNLKGQILSRNIEQSKKYGLEAFHFALIQIDAFETKAKSSGTEETILLELLIAKLT